MVMLVSLGSLSGVILVPLVSTDSKLASLIYEYIYALMIAVGASALLSDSILHLIPHVSSVASNLLSEGQESLVWILFRF